ncbi:hypothetical protein SSX86_021704 [Deinandra increscens subsp. villosa]|uniref:Cytochrome P450 n=1 Tax=Deinandra increscens subsp. villosa TaxID=3103831 RepID=A0AAP0GU29_9ASTR
MEVPYLVITLLLLASYLFTSYVRRKSSNLPPTVFPSLPLIGNLYLLKPPLYRTLAKISAKHGPILHLQLGFRRVLLVSSPSAVEESTSFSPTAPNCCSEKSSASTTPASCGLPTATTGAISVASRPSRSYRSTVSTSSTTSAWRKPGF